MEMRKFAILLTFCLFSTLSHAGSQVKHLQYTNYTPNYDDLNMIWEYVKQQTGADPDFPAPEMWAWNQPLPRNAIMAFSYPTKEQSGSLGVFIPTTTINSMAKNEYERFMWSIGHEFTHYTMFLRKNNWQFKSQFPKNKDQHCDPEFKRITIGIADLLYEKYRSESAKRVMYNEVKRACDVAPEQ